MHAILITIGPPSEPQQLTLFASSAFSAGVSWDPPSDNGGSTEPLTYTVTLTNITDGTVLQYNITTTQITLTHLLPGVQYNVSVYAQHSLATGPPVEEVFRTNYSGECVRNNIYSKIYSLICRNSFSKNMVD